MAEAGLALEAEDAENLVLTLENDIFAGTDKSYRNAVKLSWTSGDIDEYSNDGFTPKDVPALGGGWAEKDGRDIWPLRWSGIYPPEDTDSKELVEDDRPYAGCFISPLPPIVKMK